jgi:hypothetical protein
MHSTSRHYIKQILNNNKFQASASEAMAKSVSFAFAFLLPLLVDEQSFALISILLIVENILEVFVSLGVPELVVARQDFIELIYSFFISQLIYIVPSGLAAVLFLITSNFLNSINSLTGYAIILMCLAYIYSLNYIGISILRCTNLSSYARQRLLWVMCRFAIIVIGLLTIKTYAFPQGNVPIMLLTLACIGETLFYVLLLRFVRLRLSFAPISLEKKSLTEAWKLSRNFYLANIVGIATVYMYRLVLPILVRDNSNLGIFYFSTSLATSSFFSIGVLHTVLTPKIYSSEKFDRFLLLRKLLHLSLLSSVFMSGLIFGLAHTLSTMNPVQYGLYINYRIIAILCVGSFFLAVTDWIKVVFKSVGDFRLVSASSIANLLISCTLLPLILFLPNIYTVALSTSLAPIIYLIIYGRRALKSFEYLSLKEAI